MNRIEKKLQTIQEKKEKAFIPINIFTGCTAVLC